MRWRPLALNHPCLFCPTCLFTFKDTRSEANPITHWTKSNKMHCTGCCFITKSIEFCVRRTCAENTQQKESKLRIKRGYRFTFFVWIFSLSCSVFLSCLCLHPWMEVSLDAPSIWSNNQCQVEEKCTKELDSQRK